MDTQEAPQDPRRTQAQPWQERVWELARTWAAGPGMTLEGVDLVACIEYPILDALNRVYGTKRTTP